MDYTDWKWQLNHRLTGIKDLPGNFVLNAYEKAFFDGNATNTFPFVATPYYFSLVNAADPADPIRRQIIPDSRELEIKPYETSDPLGEKKYTVAPGFVHKYKDRVLLHATSLCAVHCRHCFRRCLTREKQPVISNETLEAACAYIKKNDSIEEILISGGDPLMLEDDQLCTILESLRRTRKQLTIRVGTRMPVVLPQRITENLVLLLKEYKPLWIATHFNHPAEITAQSSLALDRFICSGIPVVNQTVLLYGINDHPATLSILFRSLVNAGVKPYYLLQADLAPGTSHLRTRLNKAIRLYRELAVDLSGLALPKLAVDAPGGGGKIALTGELPVEMGHYKLEAPGGGIYWYPVE